MFDTTAAPDPGAALLAVAAGARREIARAQHAQVRAVARFHELRREEDLADGTATSAAGEFALGEVAVALGCSTVAAGRLLDVGLSLEPRPALSAAFAAGEVDLARVRVVLDRSAQVDGVHLPEVDRLTAAAARSAHGRALGARVDRIVAAVDPDGVRDRRETATRERSVVVRPAADGCATLWGRLPALDGQVLDRRLDELARAVCPTDPRTHEQLRADALTALALGTELGCACGGVHAAPQAAPPRVELVVTHDTLAGRTDDPGELRGHGPVDPALARTLAACAEQVRTAVVASGVVSELEALRYTPSAALDRLVRLRDGTCRFPGCARPSRGCDLDHREPYRHADPARGGRTTRDNLFALCRHHHRAKTLRVWSYHHLGRAVLEWTSPTGTTHVTHPAHHGPVDPPPF